MAKDSFRSWEDGSGVEIVILGGTVLEGVVASKANGYGSTILYLQGIGCCMCTNSKHGRVIGETALLDG